MKVQVTEESPIRKKIEITVPSEQLKAHIDNAYTEIGKTAKLKGFRPGKVPRKILEQHYQQDAVNKALHTLVDETYPEAVSQNDLQPLSYPDIEILSFDPTKELTYQAQFDVKPQLEEVSGYKGLKLKKEKADVSNKEIDERLQAYQQHHAKLAPIDPPRAPQDGDIVTFDYVALRDGKAFEGNTVTGYQAELGTGVLLKEFETAIENMAIGEKKEIQVTLPTDFADKQFAGKAMSYTVTLKDVKLKVVPELGDDFAKDLGFEDMAAFRAAVRQELEQSKEERARASLYQQVIAGLVKANEVLIPPSMIEMELSSLYENWKQNLAKQGQTPEGLGVTPEAFREQNNADALLRVQGMLLFEGVWRAEQLSVTDQERQDKLEALAARLGQKKDAIAKYYQADPARTGQLDHMILQDKTLDFILGQAKIETAGSDRKKK